jgi:ABC-type phosphate transport system permease subunit
LEVTKVIAVFTTLQTSFVTSFLTSLLTSIPTSAFRLQTFQKSPIIVKLVEPPKDPTGLAGVLVGALGLAGAITLVAVACGLVTAAIIYLVRSRSRSA